MLLKELREKVIEIALKAQREKLIPLTMGNFSARDRKTGYVCITPSGMEYDKLTAADIVVLDVEGSIAGEERMYSEYPILIRFLQQPGHLAMRASR